MKFFLDTANVEKIRYFADMGLVDGVTTNPSLIAKEGRDFKEVIDEITRIVDGPISAEVVSTESVGMVEEALELARIHENIVIKIPMTKEGIKATHQLASEGVRVNMTLIFSPSQALLAAKAGARYVSPFIGRLDDISTDGLDMVSDIRAVLDNYDFECEIIAASIRHPLHVIEAAKMGVDIATIPPDVMDKLFNHPLTDIGLDKFLRDWENAFKK
ncbi:fructose-6-phosphate aldolase [Hippea maritima]|uniref:Probable transaldolase n=1 Tax=Hippea maritima (strain ATCC 700847 / DSM 10411 / MH2) TaxID=760142 RepID=F2LUS8_HIPMA|nr:fructose-6-phosphate aldolase [Hippea maritima]AEA33533.1 transaldolase [Hippea maritima DSM 10411]